MIRYDNHQSFVLSNQSFQLIHDQHNPERSERKSLMNLDGCLHEIPFDSAKLRPTREKGNARQNKTMLYQTPPYVLADLYRHAIPLSKQMRGNHQTEKRPLITETTRRAQCDNTKPG
jgi:hypothetical protein